MPLLSWANPFAKWRGRKAEPASTQPPRTASASAPVPTAATAGAEPPAPPGDTRAAFIGWLLALPAAATAPAGPPANALVRRLDALIASKTSMAGLLPRAAHLVPQLMKALRDDTHSTTEMAQRISQDVVLTTEVLRVANSAGYAGRPPLTDVADAVAALGVDGLQRAIARVLLRPMFEARSEPFSRPAAPRIWQDGEAKAKECMTLAREHGADLLDAYLAGLLHGIGWTAALRTLDEAGLPGARPEMLLHPELAAAMFRRRDTLFGKLVAPWKLSAGLSALAEELVTSGLDGANSPLAQVLRRAESMATQQALQMGGAAPAQRRSG